ncbi:MAG: peptide-binding protein [Vulcanimicrobiaceae bacterium]
MMRPPRRAALLVSMLAALVGCSHAHADRRDPNTLIVMELGDTRGLNPMFSNDAYASTYETLIYDGLVAVGNDFADAPDLATSWKSSPDGKTWDVELRHGVKWSDGEPFTSRDVVWTWTTQLDPATAFPYRGQFDYLKTVTARGPYRVRFTLKNTNALFVSQVLGSFVLPEHVLGKIAHNQLRLSNFGEHPIGTGPYKLERWRHDEELDFVRNDGWYGGRPNIPKLAFRIVINDQARIEAMEEGAADVDDTIGASGYQILKTDRADVELLHVPDLYVYFNYINLKRPGLADREVRRAMMYGWDREGLTKGFARGDAEVATSILPSALKDWYLPKVRTYPYDPARARRTLDAAGWRPGPDGVRAKHGVRLAYTFLLPGSGSGATQDFAAIFQADMRAIGIAIDISSIDYATFLDKTQSGQFDLANSGWGGVPDPDQQTLLDSTQTPPNGNNEMYYKNAAVDRDVREGIKLIDKTRRKPYYDDMQRRIAEDVPVLYYQYVFYRTAISKRVKLDYASVLPDIYLWRNVARWRLSS